MDWGIQLNGGGNECNPFFMGETSVIEFILRSRITGNCPNSTTLSSDSYVDVFGKNPQLRSKFCSGTCNTTVLLIVHGFGPHHACFII